VVSDLHNQSMFFRSRCFCLHGLAVQRVQWRILFPSSGKPRREQPETGIRHVIPALTISGCSL